MSFETKDELLAKAEAILDRCDAENRNMTADEEVQFNKYTKRAELKIAAGPQGNGKRVVPAQGFSDGGMPESMFQPVQSIDSPRIVSPSGARLKAFENTRDGREAAYRSGKWLQATLLQNAEAGAWCRAHGLVPDVMGAHSGSVNTAGGALVPEEMASSVIRLVEEYGLFRRLARPWPMGSDTTHLPRRTGGLDAHYVGEGAEGTESDTSWDDVQLVAKRLIVLSRMSSEINEDAVISMADMLAQESALAFALKEDTVGFTGTGISTDGGQVGVNVMALDGSHDMAIVEAASAHDTLAEIDANDLISLMSVIPKYAKRGAVWVCSPTAEEIVFNAIKIAGGGNTSSDLERGGVNRFLGYPIEVTDVYPDDLSTNYNNAVMIGFGNLGLASTLGTRRDIRFMLSEHRYWELDQLGVKATMRHAINVHNLGSNTDKSPFAVLIGTT